MHNQGGRGHTGLIYNEFLYQRSGMGFEGIAENLNITASTAHRVYSLFERTGSTDHAPSKEKVELRQSGECAELYIIGMPKGVPWRTVS